MTETFKRRTMTGNAEKLKAEKRKRKMKARRKGKLEVYKDSSGEWRWRLKATNGEVIATSGEGYARRSYAKSMQAKVAATMREAEVIEVEDE